MRLERAREGFVSASVFCAACVGHALRGVGCAVKGGATHLTLRLAEKIAIAARAVERSVRGQRWCRSTSRLPGGSSQTFLATWPQQNAEVICQQNDNYNAKINTTGEPNVEPVVEKLDEEVPEVTLFEE